MGGVRCGQETKENIHSAACSFSSGTEDQPLAGQHLHEQLPPTFFRPHHHLYCYAQHPCLSCLAPPLHAQVRRWRLRSGAVGLIVRPMLHLWCYPRIMCTHGTSGSTTAASQHTDFSWAASLVVTFVNLVKASHCSSWLKTLRHVAPKHAALCFTCGVCNGAWWPLQCTRAKSGVHELCMACAPPGYRACSPPSPLSSLPPHPVHHSAHALLNAVWRVHHQPAFVASAAAVCRREQRRQAARPPHNTAPAVWRASSRLAWARDQQVSSCMVCAVLGTGGRQEL